jgi:hypothetical protein
MQYKSGILFWAVLVCSLLICVPTEVTEGLSARMHSQGN